MGYLISRQLGGGRLPFVSWSNVAAGASAGGSRLMCIPLFVFVWWVFSVTGFAEAVHEEQRSMVFEEANRLYEQGKYEEAVGAYLKILDGGVVSSAVYFNLGNAYFKLGQLGRAIVYYRKAQQLAPRDPDIRANLEFVRAAVGGGSVPVQPFWQRMVTRLTLDEWAILTAGALWLFGGCQAVRQLTRFAFFERRSVTLVTAALLLTSLSGLGSAWHLAARQYAVVIRPDTVLHHGPLEESPSVQVLPDGQELAVLDRKDDWLQVEGAARGIGWVQNNNVILLP